VPARRRRRKKACSPSAGHIPFTPRAKKALELALRKLALDTTISGQNTVPARPGQRTRGPRSKDAGRKVVRRASRTVVSFARN
jgi:hypothetical protein